jgi:hypothetical protein
MRGGAARRAAMCGGAALILFVFTLVIAPLLTPSRATHVEQCGASGAASGAASKKKTIERIKKKSGGSRERNRRAHALGTREIVSWN